MPSSHRFYNHIYVLPTFIHSFHSLPRFAYHPSIILHLSFLYFIHSFIPSFHLTCIHKSFLHFVSPPNYPFIIRSSHSSILLSESMVYTFSPASSTYILVTFTTFTFSQPKLRTTNLKQSNLTTISLF